MAEKQYSKRFDATLFRLGRELINLRLDLAALVALDESEKIIGRRSKLLMQCGSAMQGDILIRLIRLFEEDSKVGSFWYLHRCEPKRVSEGINVPRLSDFSSRLKCIRDKTFVHIDKHGVFDVAAIYKKAGITGPEIRENVETIWQVLKKLGAKGVSEFHWSVTTEQLVDKYRRDLKDLSLKS